MAIDEAICACIKKFTKDKRSEFSEGLATDSIGRQAVDLKGIGFLVMDGTGLANTSARSTSHQENTMGNNTSPLESLAAFAIVFAVGVISTLGLGKYIEKVKRDAETGQPS